MADGKRLRWELTDDEKKRTEGFPSHLILSPEKARFAVGDIAGKVCASYDGGEPRTPAEWLEVLLNIYLNDAGDTDVLDFTEAYAVLSDLLGGTDE